MSGTRKAKVGEDVRRAGFMHSVSSDFDEDALADAGDEARVQMVPRRVLNALLNTVYHVVDAVQPLSGARRWWPDAIRDYKPTDYMRGPSSV